MQEPQELLDLKVQMVRMVTKVPLVYPVLMVHQALKDLLDLQDL